MHPVYAADLRLAGSPGALLRYARAHVPGELEPSLHAFNWRGTCQYVESSHSAKAGPASVASGQFSPLTIILARHQRCVRPSWGRAG